MRGSAEEGHKRRGIPLPFAIAAHEDQPPKCAPLPLGVVVSCDSTRIRPNEARARTSMKASGIFLISSCAATISSAGVAAMVQSEAVQKVVSDKLVAKTIFVKGNDSRVRYRPTQEYEACCALLARWKGGLLLSRDGHRI